MGMSGSLARTPQPPGKFRKPVACTTGDSSKIPRTVFTSSESSSTTIARCDQLRLGTGCRNRRWKPQTRIEQLRHGNGISHLCHGWLYLLVCFGHRYQFAKFVVLAHPRCRCQLSKKAPSPGFLLLLNLPPRRAKSSSACCIFIVDIFSFKSLLSISQPALIFHA